MPLLAPRFVPPVPRPAGLAAAYLAVGLVLAPALDLAWEPVLGWLSDHASGFFFAAMMGVNAGMILLFLLPLIFLCRITQRPLVVLPATAAYAAGATVGSLAATGLLRADGGADLSAWLTGGAVLEQAGAAGLFAVLGTIVWAVARFVVRRVAEHAPGQCAWCGYALGVTGVPVCPECGTATSPPRFRNPRSIALGLFLSRRGVALLAAVLLAGGAYAAWRTATRGLPSAAFYARFPTADRLDISAFWPGAAHRGAHLEGTPCVFVERAPGSDRGLFVWFDPQLRGDTPMMVGVAGRPPMPRFGPVHGSVYVQSRLSRPQAEAVLRDGIPPGLADALYARAESVKWTPGGTSGPVEIVPAAPHFSSP